MAAEVYAAAIAAAAAVISAVIAYRGSLRVAHLTAELDRAKQHDERDAAATRLLARFRDPLGQATYDLQSRLYNILERDFAKRYLGSGEASEQQYVIDNTSFLIAQFLGWRELIRTEIQFLDLGTQAQTRRLNELQDVIVSLWQTESLPRPFRIWAGDQRAIGERMLRNDRCIGYARFLDRLQRQPNRLRLLDPIRADLRRMTALRFPDLKRLAALQIALIDLLAFIDPDGMRFPMARRCKVRLPESPSN